MRTKDKECLLDMTGYLHFHDLTASVVACTRPAQDQASHDSSMEEGEAQESPSQLSYKWQLLASRGWKVSLK